MDPLLQRVDYSELNARQQENYNFHHLAARLSEFGYHSMPMNDDWNGADLVAIHINGSDVLRVQMKGRLVIAKKYAGQSLYIAFPADSEWFLYPHDRIMSTILTDSRVAHTSSWVNGGMYSWPTLSEANRRLLEPWRLS